MWNFDMSYQVAEPTQLTETLIFFRFSLCSLDIEDCDSCNCDSAAITSSYGYLGARGFCGRNSPTYHEHLSHVQGELTFSTISGRNIYIRFVSDDTVNYKGFKFSYIVQSRSCR